jgi:hypothetical protein
VRCPRCGAWVTCPSPEHRVARLYVRCLVDLDVEDAPLREPPGFPAPVTVGNAVSLNLGWNQWPTT